MTKLKSTVATCVLALTSVFISQSALAADPPKDAPKGEGHGEGRGRGRHEGREHRDGMHGDAGLTKEARDEMRKKRKEHRLRELQKRFGEALSAPATKEELKLHARRMARLHRIEHLAKGEKKDAIVKRAEEAIQKEKARHEKKMEALKGGGDAGTPAAKAVGSASAAPAATGGAK